MTTNTGPAWVLVPVKDFVTAKGRLATVLNPEERRSLAEAMLRDVIVATGQASSVAGISLTGTADARRLANEYDLDWLTETTPRGLNAALQAGAEQLHERGVGTLLILPDDLPTITANDIQSFLIEHTNGLSISPAARDGGTNALAISPANALSFHYGPESARRHMETALAAGLPARKICLQAFARDIDQPEDLQWLDGQQPGPYTRAVLQSIAVGGQSSMAAAQG